MPTMAELERALVNADKAGDMDAARKLTQVITEARKDPANSIPGNPIPFLEAKTPESSLGQKAIGALEAGASLATGATTGALATVGATLGGVAGQILNGQFGDEQALQLVTCCQPVDTDRKRATR